MIVPKYFEDIHTLHVGTEPVRSYYIPAARELADPVLHREASQRFRLLNGDWKFRYCESVYDFADRFYVPGFDASHWDTIPVPAVWQNHGYDRHQYTNVRYPFPADAPYVPYENPCGAYLRTFSYAKDPEAPCTFLNFEGVDSCFYVWVNGQLVGYSQVSHSTSEFDITPMVREGTNTLAVLVLKWCDGSYLEDQDKFRTSGIFRDVYLLSRPQASIRDYFTTTGPDSAEIRFAYRGSPVSTKATLRTKEGKIVAQGLAAEGAEGDYTHQVTLTVKEPTQWNPELPYLYTLVLETPGEVITDQVGLRQVTVADNRVLLNGKPILFCGVNRHDSDPILGPAVPLEHMIRDLKLIKSHNFNAIRSSHYPNSPLFPCLCDRYGFLLVDEADCESHGTTVYYRKHNEDWNEHVAFWNKPFADNPDYLEATMDRVQRCVRRDKNRPSVVAWSMGNESGFGCCYEAALAWTKAFDPSRLTHYESAQYHDDLRKYDFSNIDLYSNMYPELATLESYVANSPDKPYLLCEYAHAMGNSPGDLEDYWQFFRNNPVMCGGFVWEWCDHAVYKGQAGNGKPMYWYGGDHGEFPHDGNFCLDGLVYPDRTPHTGLLECKNVYRPARVTDFDRRTGKLTLRSYLDFLRLDQYLTVSYELTRDGAVIQKGHLCSLPAIKPRGSGVLQLYCPVPTAGRCYLRLYYYLKEADALRPAGHPLGFDELLLENEDSRNQTAKALWEEKPEGTGLTVEDGRWLTVSGGDFSYRYDPRTGCFTQMVFHGQTLLEKPMQLNVWRAPTDNDWKIKRKWMDAQYHRMAGRGYETRWEQTPEGIRIRTGFSLAAPGKQPALKGTLEWLVEASGSLRVTIQARRDVNFPELPRFGLRLFLPRELEQVTYFGLGPMESYVDKRRAAWHGTFSTTVSQLHEGYIRPQENGSHSDCDYCILEGGGLGLGVVSDVPFSFNASHFTQEELTEKAHNYELEESGSTVLCLDYRQNGIGSNSCGPALSEKYRLDEEHLRFSIRLIPKTK